MVSEVSGLSRYLLRKPLSRSTVINTATKTWGLVGEHFFSMVQNLSQKKATEASQSNIEIRAGENHWEHYEKRKRAKKHALITVEDTSKDGMN